MSLKVMLWVQESAPVKNHGELAVLYALADRASDDGTGAYPSQAWIAYRARCSERTVRNHLSKLEERGVIRRGDQRIVGHFRGDRKPVVWDIDISQVRDDLFNDRGSAHSERGEDSAGRQVLQSRAANIAANGGQILPTNQSSKPVPKPVLTPIVPTGDEHEAPALFDDESPSFNDSPETELEHQLDQVMEAYPYASRTSRKVARQKLKAALKKTDFDTIMAGIRGYAAECERKRTEMQYTAHLATWFNQERWTVDYGAVTASKPGGTTDVKSRLSRLRRG